MLKKQHTKNLVVPSELRSIAEERLKLNQSIKKEIISAPEEIHRMNHELAVHQIELEMQQEELVQSRSELEKTLKRYTALYDFAPLGYLTLGRDSTIIEANLTASKIFGVERSRLQGMHFKTLVFSEDCWVVDALLEKIFIQNVPAKCEIRIVTDDIEASQGKHNQVTHILRIDAAISDTTEECRIIISDITDRKIAEKKLIESENRLNQALTAARAGVWEWDMKTNDNYWSDEIWPLYGLERSNENPSYHLWLNTVHPDDRAMVIQALTTATGNMTELNIEYRICNPDGSVQWLMSRGMPLRDGKGQVERYIGTIIDITERKQSEAALKQSEERFRKLFENHSAVMILLDPDTGSIIAANPAAARFYGWPIETLQNMYIQQITNVTPEEVKRNMENVRNSKQKEFCFCHKRSDGTVRDVEVFSNKIEIHGKDILYAIIHDITDRKLLESERENLQLQLQQAQKMQLVGQLAGGIAHDFNNMLTVILGHTEIALEKADVSSDDLVAIQKAASHSAELTRQLLAFARRQTVVAKIFDLNASIEGMLSMLRRLLGENIRLRWIPRIQDASVKLDPTQIDQILVNLCINARDAIDNNGDITIQTDKIHVLHGGISAGHPCTIPGDFITLTITDNGQGIDKKHLPHILEPFFTTKEVGKGTGMGLSTVYGIIKQSKGFIDVKSELGKGTSVSIYLPFYQYDAAAESTEDHNLLLSHGKEFILLVEDQADILKLCRLMLEHGGYSVLAAASTTEAIQLADHYKEKIDLLVTDVIMPEMNGNTLFKKLQLTCPSLKVLYMSGYTADFIANHLDTYEGINFIEKPFSMNALKQAIQKILQTNPPPAPK